MIASFLLSQTLVPVSCQPADKNGNRLIRQKINWLRLKRWQSGVIRHTAASRTWVLPLATILLLGGAYAASGRPVRKFFRGFDTGQLQLRLRMPPGTRIERTEDAAKKILQLNRRNGW